MIETIAGWLSFLAEHPDILQVQGQLDLLITILETSLTTVETKCILFIISEILQEFSFSAPCHYLLDTLCDLAYLPH